MRIAFDRLVARGWLRESDRAAWLAETGDAQYDDDLARRRRWLADGESCLPDVGQVASGRQFMYWMDAREARINED